MKTLLLLNIIMILVIGVSGQEKYKARYACISDQDKRPVLGYGNSNLGVNSPCQKNGPWIFRNYNPWKWSGIKFKHWLVQPELRYWLCDQFSGHFFGVHTFYANLICAGLGVRVETRIR
ncbi:MAG: DUF3575 domain-containing protein [Butyricimonas paravirosa]